MIQDKYIRSDAWLTYAIKKLDKETTDIELEELKSAALFDHRIQKMLVDISEFHKNPIKNHKNPDLSIHKLLFLLDLGFDQMIPEINIAIHEILKHKDQHGVYLSKINIPTHFGGTGESTFNWCLCDAPLLLKALILAGIDYEAHIKKGVDHLIKLSRSNGFPCAASEELGKFRGPGKKEDCCPYATLIMIDLLSLIPEYKHSKLIKEQVNSLLNLWITSLQSHPYLFYMGTDFRKLKAPTIWYDLLSLLNVLSRLDFVHHDSRYMEMLNLLKNKQNKDGYFTPESIYTMYKDWDFGQKKKPSNYLTFICQRIINRSLSEK